MRKAALLAVLLVPLLAGCFSVAGGGGRTGWAYAMVQLDAAAATGRTGRGVTVAILDTGINVGHPSMDHLVDTDMTNGQLVAFKDFLGTASTVAGAFDDDGHGTHVAGIISARGSTGLDKLGGIDLQGGAPGVLLVVARVCSTPAGQSETTCDPDAIAAALPWAVNEGADIISLSLGGKFNLAGALQQRSIEQAITDAVNKGTVVIASAGNRGEDSSSTDVESPADIPDVIAVGAVDSGGHVASFSSRGNDARYPCNGLPLPGALGGRCRPNQKPELVAPGVEILSAWTGKDYVVASGTSQATPFVTAVVALMLEGKPDLSNHAAVVHVKQVLVDTAKPVDGQHLPHDDAAGYGIVQAQAALQAYG